MRTIGGSLGGQIAATSSPPTSSSRPGCRSETGFELAFATLGGGDGRSRSWRRSRSRSRLPFAPERARPRPARGQSSSSAGTHGELEQRAVADERARSTSRPISSATISRWRSVAELGGLAVELEDHVADANPGALGRAVGDDLDHLDPALGAGQPPARAAAAAAGRRRSRGRRGGPRPRRSARAMIRRVVAETGTASPRPTPATAVLTPTTRPRPSASAPPELPGLSAASVWITLSITRTARAGPRGQRPAERRDDPGGDRALEPVRVADRDHELADPQLLGVAELGRRRRSSPSARTTARSESGSLPSTVEAELAPVGEPRGAAGVAAGDDVRGGEDEAVVR